MADEYIKQWCKERGFTFVRWTDRDQGIFEATNDEAYPAGGCELKLDNLLPPKVL